MITFNEKSGVVLQSGEQYAEALPGRLTLDLDNYEIDDDNAQIIYTGTHRGRPCVVRYLLSLPDFLDGLPDPDRFCIYTVPVLRYTSTSM